MCVLPASTLFTLHKPGNVVDFFNFIQPNGVLQLHLQTPQQLGWRVIPEENQWRYTCNTIIIEDIFCEVKISRIGQK